LKWTVDVNWNMNRNKVTSLSGTESLFLAGFEGSASRAVLNQPIGVLWGGKWARDESGKLVLDANGFPTAADKEGVIGDPNPLYKITAINSVSYKGFSFNMQWEFTQGGDMYANTPSVLIGRGVVGNGDVDRNQFLVLPGVLADGSPNNIQTTYTDAYFDNTIAGGAASELGIYDATVLRLRELSLSYQLPEKFLKKSPFGGVSFSVSGQNLWYYAPRFPDDTNFDPEASGLGVSNGRGLEFFSGPSTRRIGASLKITF